MRKKIGVLLFSLLTIFSLTGCSLLPNILPDFPSDSSSQSSNNSSQPSSNSEPSQSEPSTPTPVQYYTVTFNSNGGSSVPSQSVAAGAKATKPTDPTRDGYEFSGWYYDGSLWNFNNPVNRNIILYADWTRIEPVETTYTARFYNDDNTLLYAQSGYHYGDVIEYLGPIPEKPLSTRMEGYAYRFLCWDKDLVIYGNTDFFALYEQEAVDDWGEGTYVQPSSEDTVGYTRYYNAAQLKTKIEIKALDGTLAEGSSIKSGTPNPFMKLSSNNNQINYKFNFAGQGIGTIYMRGVIDSWTALSSYSNLDYYYSASNVVNDEYPGQGNFALRFNGDLVDYSHMRGVTYAQLLSGGEDVPGLDSSYSPIADCEIGEIEVVNGINEFSFIRLASYNLLVSDFVIVIKNLPGGHTHEYATFWAYNDYGHWHPCISGDGSKGSYGTHVFGDPITVRQATCYQEGLIRHVCQTCGYTKEEVIPATDHAWNPWEITRDATCTHEGSRKHTCQMCGVTESEIIPQKDHLFGQISTYTHEGCANSGIYECVYCQYQASKWDAHVFDSSLSNDVDNYSEYVRFGAVENLNGVEQRGSHIVYKYYSAQPDRNVKLSFEITSNGSSKCVFDLESNDTSRGYDYDEQGNLVEATKRYGLIVNGQKIQLGDDPYYGQTSSSSYKWYYWPATFDLAMGENTIEIYCLGTYRARIRSFMISGFHMATSNMHNHVLGDWHHDETYHWRECINDGCPFLEGTQLEKGEHSYVLTESDENGYRKYTCSVCGREKEYNTNLSGNTLAQWSGQDLKAACPNEITSTVQFANGMIGIKTSNVANYGPITLNYQSQSSRKAVLALCLAAKVANADRTGFWEQSGIEKTRITVNGQVIEPPPEDLVFNDAVFRERDETATDGSALSIPVWTGICNLDLIQGENTIEIAIINNNYSYFICGAKLVELS